MRGGAERNVPVTAVLRQGAGVVSPGDRGSAVLAATESLESCVLSTRADEAGLARHWGR